jgi:hypothetical protein
MPRAARRATVLLAVFAAAGVLAASALADIDPASDILPLQNVFLPYHPKTCTQLSRALRTLTTETEAKGYSIKVAIIGSKNDLGGASDLFGQPQEYARFLAQELRTFSPDFGTSYGNQPLLIAMPGKWALDHGGAKAEKALGAVSIPDDSDPNALARAALIAIPKLAQAEGHPVPAPRIPSGCTKSGGTSALIYIAPMALLLLVGLVAGSRLRPRGAESDRA